MRTPMPDRLAGKVAPPGFHNGSHPSLHGEVSVIDDQMIEAGARVDALKPSSVAPPVNLLAATPDPREACTPGLGGYIC